jgi:hypothetical protein
MGTRRGLLFWGINGMENMKDPRKRNITLGEGLAFSAGIFIFLAYCVIFVLITGHGPRGGSRWKTDPDGWEFYLGLFLGGLGAWLVLILYKKITGRKL